MKQIKLFFMTLLIFVSSVAFAQKIQISGVVTDSSTGEPIPFATIQIKGTQTGTASNGLGEYAIQVTANDVLIFSSISYKNQEVAVNGRSVIDVKLEPDAVALEDVVVVAFGTVTKKDFTGSAASMDGKKLEKRPMTNAMNALEGVTSGVQFSSASGQPGSSGSIRIRGFGSINASNDPLYIVDGVPYGDGLSNLNAEDIESMSILKDAASSALYGSRAANGVVIITTKKGRSDKLTVNVKINQGISVRGIPEYDRLDAYQYYPLMWEAARNGFLSVQGTSHTMATASQKASADIVSLLGTNPFNVADNAVVGTDGTLNSSAKLLYPDDLDWSDAIARTGYKQEYNFSASGATQKSDYYFSAGYMKEDGYTIKSYLDRATARMNMNVNPVKWLKAGLNLSGTYSKSNTTNTDSATGYINPFYFSRNIGPIYPIYKHNADGSYLLDELGEKQYEWENRGTGASPGRHIIAETLWNDNLNIRTALNSRAYADITFFKGLKLSLNLGYDLRNQNNSHYDNPHVGDGSPAGRSGVDIYLYETMNFNQLLTYTNSFNRHNIDVLVGHESYSREYDYTYGLKQGLIAEGNIKLINFTTINSFSGYSGLYRTEGYLARANYNYDSKYYVSASFRRDGTSRFSKQARWGNFWSIGGSWRADQESFIRDIDAISTLKVRASYGLVGNDGTDSWYAWQSLYGINRYGNEPGFIQSTAAGNVDLEWEVNKSADLAIDYGFINDRISGTLEFFHRQSSNLLFSVPQPESSGVLSQWQNIGTMYNQGIEFMINADIIRNKDFKWTSSLNATHLKNEITKMPENQPTIISGTKQLEVGHSIYDFYMYDGAGVDPANGDALYWKDEVDSEGNVIKERAEKTNDYTVASKYYVGTSIPAIYGTWTNSISWKGLEFSLLLNYQIGGKIFNSTVQTLMGTDYGRALYVGILDRWQQAGDVTDVPRFDAARTTYQNATSSRFLMSASYLGIRNATLSYSFPTTFCKKLTMSGLSVYVSGENLYTFTAMKGMNPQYGFAGTQSNVYGFARTLTFGLNVRF